MGVIERERGDGVVDGRKKSGCKRDEGVKRKEMSRGWRLISFRFLISTP